MNKLEYIPGDLVYIHGCFRVISNCDGYYATYYDENESLQEVNVNVIEGIPIIPEILEKSGWKHKKEFGEYWFIPRNEDYELLALDKVGEEWTIYIEENCSNFEYIKFVHQLQHLLFGLNLNSDLEV